MPKKKETKPKFFKPYQEHKVVESTMIGRLIQIKYLKNSRKRMQKKSQSVKMGSVGKSVSKTPFQSVKYFY